MKTTKKKWWYMDDFTKGYLIGAIVATLIMHLDPLGFIVKLLR